jgi:hypothetical protein
MFALFPTYELGEWKQRGVTREGENKIGLGPTPFMGILTLALCKYYIKYILEV